MRSNENGPFRSVWIIMLVLCAPVVCFGLGRRFPVDDCRVETLRRFPVAIVQQDFKAMPINSASDFDYRLLSFDATFKDVLVFQSSEDIGNAVALEDMFPCLGVYQSCLTWESLLRSQFHIMGLTQGRSKVRGSGCGIDTLEFNREAFEDRRGTTAVYPIHREIEPIGPMRVANAINAHISTFGEYRLLGGFRRNSRSFGGFCGGLGGSTCTYESSPEKKKGYKSDWKLNDRKVKGTPCGVGDPPLFLEVSVGNERRFVLGLYGSILVAIIGAYTIDWGVHLEVWAKKRRLGILVQVFGFCIGLGLSSIIGLWGAGAL
jgi:hypothetical protein